jgi:hypothetical protein
MLLRDHPLMSYHGVPNWPPTWTWMRGREDNYPRGEVGILKAALPSKLSQGAVAFYLFLIKDQNISAACYSMTPPSASI